ncbi:acyl-CoA thioesterase [Fluviispira sanaruensis]|uniref:Esterase n=1 Tax=Fluviispira sanaruensis TaxID=2493639 RepID=A0A4P2VNE4_FLUSA|nr:thioesterase family protein [Fluviispira sanaruensis]BBH54621.1 esterase [Fluviispira sanaruensis]
MSKSKIEFDSKNIIFEFKTRVRIDDINYGNHLGHDKLISIIHDSRMNYFNRHEISELMPNISLGIIIVNLNIDYISQAKFNDFLSVHIASGDIKNSSFELLYKITNSDGILVGLCSTTMVCFDTNRKKPVKIPDIILEILKK